MASVYLNINLDEFNKTLKEAKEEAMANGSENQATWADLRWNINTDITEISDDGKIYLSGDIDNLGYLSTDFTLDIGDIADLIEVYIKKLNRLKTVLEATSK